jgi:hypothetical protein
VADRVGVPPRLWTLARLAGDAGWTVTVDWPGPEQVELTLTPPRRLTSAAVAVWELRGRRRWRLCDVRVWTGPAGRWDRALLRDLPTLIAQQTAEGEGCG